MTDAEDTLPFAPTGPSLLEGEGAALAPEATRLDAIPGGPPPPRGEEVTRVEDVARTRFDGVVPNHEGDSALGPGRAPLEVTRVHAAAIPPEALRPDPPPLALEDTPLSGPPGAMTDVESVAFSPEASLDPADPTQVQAFGRPSEVAIVGFKPYAAAPASALPVARPGLRVRESVRATPSLPTAPLPKVLPKTPLPRTSRAGSSVEDPPAIGVDPAVYPVTYQPSSGARVWVLGGAVVLVAVIGLVMMMSTPAPDPVAEAAERQKAQVASLVVGLPPGTSPLPTTMALSDPANLRPRGEPTPRVRRPLRPTGRPARRPAPIASLVRPLPPAERSATRKYDVGEAPPSPSPNLYVYTDPPGALVEVNGELWGMAPLLRPAIPIEGAAKVRVFLDGYLERTASVSPNELGHYEGFFTLEPDSQVGHPLPGAPAPPAERPARTP
ncbi:MAG: PEGA domain-containing protein [Deltaproteobacteria bacterium]|nr:PEGA domain-containing protein [Deltaproteobacteria bacterium]